MCKVSPLCVCLSLVAAFILAAILAVLFFFGIAPSLFEQFFLAFDLVFAVLAGLAILLIIILKHPNNDIKRCLCCFAKGILILGVIFLIVLFIALAFNLYPWSILDAIIVFFFYLFLFSFIFYVAAFIFCLIKELCKRPCHTDNN